MMTLTTRQQHVLDLLVAYQREHGFPPTNFELAGLLGRSRSGHTNRLIQTVIAKFGLEFCEIGGEIIAKSP